MTYLLTLFGLSLMSALGWYVYVKKYPPDEGEVDEFKTPPDAKFAPLEPLPSPDEPHSVKKPTLTMLCTSMRDFEGKPGDANYRNNNPLNCKYYYGGYLPIYQPVRISPAGFAIFKDYQTGWLYGFNMLKHKIEKHPNWTLYDLIANHAPQEDNNSPKEYATFVAKRLGVDIAYKVSDLVLV